MSSGLFNYNLRNKNYVDYGSKIPISKYLHNSMQDREREREREKGKEEGKNELKNNNTEISFIY